MKKKIFTDFGLVPTWMVVLIFVLLIGEILILGNMIYVFEFVLPKLGY